MVFLVAVAVFSMLGMVIALPGYLDSPLGGWLGPAAMLVNLAGLVASQVLLPKVLDRAPSFVEAPDEERERRVLRYALVIDRRGPHRPA